MKTNYLEDSWSDISRDERYFCAELYQIIKDNKYPFNQLLVKKEIIDSVHTDYEIGYEVCFYRDYIFRYGYENGLKENKNHHIRTINNLNVPAKVRVREKESKKIITIDKTIDKFPFKRTFDLCLFLEEEIIIIEAKAQQGFKIDQLSSFDEDHFLLKKLLKNKINVKVIGLHSSHYSLSADTITYFDAVITWNEIYEEYPIPYKILDRANKCYKPNCS